MVLIIEIALGIVLGFFILGNLDSITRMGVKVTKAILVLCAIAVTIGVVYWAYQTIAHTQVKDAGHDAANPTNPHLTEKTSVSTALANALQNSAPPVPEFSDQKSRLFYVRWLGEMSERLKSRTPNETIRREFLQTVWYESKRAEVKTSLVLGLIESASNFKKFNVGLNGSRGYMGVEPIWTAKLGDGNAGKLFHMQTNLRYGCVILRHGLDQENGDQVRGLVDYFQANLDGAIQGQSQSDFLNAVLSNERHWEL